MTPLDDKEMPYICSLKKPVHFAFPYIRQFAGIICISVLIIFTIISAYADENSENPFPPNSPEHAALNAASKFLADDAFLLRQDYWKGNLTTELGKALRLQFFKGNRYRFFFAVSKDRLPEKALLHLHVYDKASHEVATTSSTTSTNVIDLEFKPKSTGLYLVLMSIEVPKDSSALTDIPSAMFYGYE